MSQRTTRPSDRTAVAPANDQIDALVGIALESAKLMHAALGLAPETFDFDRTRDQLYRTAAAPVGRNSRADRYRAHARRGVHASHAHTGAHVDRLLPCEGGDAS
jgi:hypothetical protein